MNSRFLHLVATNVIRGRRAYTFHLIDPSRFFHPTTPSHGSTDNIKEMEEFQLAPSFMTFHGPSQLGDLGAMEFMPLGAPSRKGIVAVDRKCRTILLDTATHAVSTMPALRAPKVSPVSISVGDSLYVLKTNAMPDEEHCFEALIRERGPESRCSQDWYWHTLPPPPHVLYPSDELNEVCFRDIIGHALFGASYIWLSTEHAGTYSFCTVQRSWSKVGNWAMPFDGRAEYIPELEVSLGFSSDNLLCASDLVSISLPHPPKLLGKWEDVVQSEKWTPISSELVPLGSGKVFIAKFFEIREKRCIQDDCVYGNSECFAVFTGVELKKSGGQLRMRKHKSMRFTPNYHFRHWVI